MWRSLGLFRPLKRSPLQYLSYWQHTPMLSCDARTTSLERGPLPLALQHSRRFVRLLTPEPEHIFNPVQSRVLGHSTSLCRTFLSFGDGDEDTGLSKRHEEHRLIGYSSEQLFDVVAAVDLYEDFVPWCQKSTVLRRTENILDAELEIGFKFFVERYISHVELKRPTLIKTSVSQSTLFKYLINEWEFKPGPTLGTCNLHFLVDFEFRSPLYRQVANMFFNEVVSRLVSSFEERCHTVYGPSAKVLEDSQVA